MTKRDPDPFLQNFAPHPREPLFFSSFFDLLLEPPRLHFWTPVGRLLGFFFGVFGTKKNISENTSLWDPVCVPKWLEMVSKSMTK